jgi:hypothetical protein
VEYITAAAEERGVPSYTSNDITGLNKTRVEKNSVAG